MKILQKNLVFSFYIHYNKKFLCENSIAQGDTKSKYINGFRKILCRPVVPFLSGFRSGSSSGRGDFLARSDGDLIGTSEFLSLGILLELSLLRCK